jgi:hypothetical protein
VRRSFPNLPYDEAAATWHGEERARLEALGKPAPLVDGIDVFKRRAAYQSSVRQNAVVNP